jgi:hypothetical protein
MYNDILPFRDNQHCANVFVKNLDIYQNLPWFISGDVSSMFPFAHFINKAE